jgi:hypothetical protein
VKKADAQIRTRALVAVAPLQSRPRPCRSPANKET